MRCSIKLIVKFGLIAEIITAIIGSIGEYSLRYQIYSTVMDELFGPYFDKELLASVSKSAYAHQHHHVDWPSNHQHYDHQTGESFRLSQLNDMAVVNDKPQDDPPNDSNQTFLQRILNRFSLWLFPHRSSPSIFDPYHHGDEFHLDPRPLLVLAVLVLMNVIFIFAVAMEYLPLIAMMSLSWIFYLIMLFVVVKVMNDSAAKINQSFIALHGSKVPKVEHLLSQQASDTTVASWSTLLPSPFVILVVIIILLFSFILIALIAEERRQIAARIRARSSCIPLVKSRDMDLDDI